MLIVVAQIIRTIGLISGLGLSLQGTRLSTFPSWPSMGSNLPCCPSRSFHETIWLWRTPFCPTFLMGTDAEVSKSICIAPEACRWLSAPSYEVGDCVWLPTRNLNLWVPTPKLAPRFVSPFQCALQGEPGCLRSCSSSQYACLQCVSRIPAEAPGLQSLYLLYFLCHIPGGQSCKI